MHRHLAFVFLFVLVIVLVIVIVIAIVFVFVFVIVVVLQRPRVLRRGLCDRAPVKRQQVAFACLDFLLWMLIFQASYVRWTRRLLSLLLLLLVFKWLGVFGLVVSLYDLALRNVRSRSSFSPTTRSSSMMSGSLG